MAEQDPKTPVSKDMLDFQKVGCYTWVQNCTFTVKPGEAYPLRTIKWIYYSKVVSVASCRFQIDLLILACVMSCEFKRKVVMKFLPAPFFWIWCKCLLRNFKDFQSDQIQRSSRKIFTAHYAYRNAPLNLTRVMGTTNGFIFQIINSLIESWGVRKTCLECNIRLNKMLKLVQLTDAF